MKIVIDIPHRVYKLLRIGYRMSLIDSEMIEGAIRNGTSLDTLIDAIYHRDDIWGLADMSWEDRREAVVDIIREYGGEE